jgi:hypothetical protein
MAICYVSNQNINGYPLGNDATAVKGNPALPYLTHTAALTAATAGVDSIYTNPTPTAYAENGGSGYFNLNKSIVAMRTDPALLGTAGKATITWGSTGRAFNSSASNVLVADYFIDAQGAAGNGISLGVTTGVVLENIEILNISGTNAAISAGSAGAQSATIRKCKLAKTGSTAATARFFTLGAVNSASANFTFEGCSATGVFALFYSSQASGTYGTYRFTRAADGTRNTIDNCTFGIRHPGGTSTVAEMSIQYTDMVNMTDAAGFGYYDGGVPSTSTAKFVYQYNTYNGTQPRAVLVSASTSDWTLSNNNFVVSGATARCVTTRNIAINNAVMSNNSFVGTSMTLDLVDFAMMGSGATVTGNYFSSDATNAHHFFAGGDGYIIAATNASAASSQRNLGSAAANQYVSCKFQTVASNAIYNFTKLAAIQVRMRKVGSPTGVVNGYLYSDNAGVPGTLLDTATFTLPVNPTFSGANTVEFYFKNFPTLSYSTVYHLVIKNSVVDASNYWQIDQNGTIGTGDGSIQSMGTSSNGTAWTPDATKGACIQLCQLNREATNMFVGANTFVSTMTATTGALQHVALFNGTDGSVFDQNIILNGQGIGILFKLATNGKASRNLIHINKGGDSSGQCLRNKGSDGVVFYQNTVVVTKSAAVCVNLDSDFISSGNYSPSFNGRIAENTTVRNDILYRDSDTAGWIFQLGNANPNSTNVTGFTETNNTVYAGANTQVARVASSNYDQAGWIGLGYGANDVWAHPLLAKVPPTSAADFIPSASSPTKRAGISLSGAVPNDYAGIAFANPPDMGAYNCAAPSGGRSTSRYANTRTQGRYTGRPSQGYTEKE